MRRSWTDVVDGAINLRHRLHRHPELAWSEERTATAVRDRLDEIGISWRACAGTGTVATLAGDAPGRHIALRADIDGIAVPESADHEPRSDTDGVMHACGHDGHTAALLAAAEVLHDRRVDLPGPVTLLFQPAEEGGHGAKAMIADGALDKVDVVFGWHNWPAILFGRAACPDGAVMSGNGTFEITVTGVGGHASQPEVTRDPVLAAAAITMALQQIVSRRVAPQLAAVVAVTSIDARSGLTVTPATATLSGSIRVPDVATRDQLFADIEEIAADTARAYGVEAKTVPSPRYDATINHAAAAAELRDAMAPDITTSDDVPIAIPVMASEDFSDYLAVVPGAFALVGSGTDRVTASCHSPDYLFNDDLIAPVANTFIRLAGLPPSSGPERPAATKEQQERETRGTCDTRPTHAGPAT